MTSMLHTLYNYRGFIAGSVKREFQLKYRRSMLGAAWTVIQPLSMILVYTVIFAQIMRAKLPGVERSFGYSIYLCAGLLAWDLFVEIANRSQNVFIENANLLKKLNFPRLSLPAIIVSTALLNFSIIFGLFLLFLIVSGNFPGWIILATLPALIIQIAFAIGLGLTIGVLNVFFRDIGQFFSIVLQFWFWLTPIVYPASILPERIKALMHLNPMAGIIQAYQSILVHAAMPNWGDLIPAIILSALFAVTALLLVRQKGGEMVDEL